MSCETPLDETEIHDLVLMFANSRLPRGSDAFQTLIDDFLKPDTPEPTSIDSIIISDPSATSFDEPDGKLAVSDSANTASISVASAQRPSTLPTVPQTPSKRKTVRMVSPKPSVHWPDEVQRGVTSSPTSGHLHSARLYKKTTPKPILKHEDSVVVQGLKSPT